MYNTLQPVHWRGQCRVRTVWGGDTLRAVRLFVLGCHQTTHVGLFVKRLWAILGLLKAIFIFSLLAFLASRCGQNRVLANAAQLTRQPGENPVVHHLHREQTRRITFNHR